MTPSATGRFSMLAGGTSEWCGAREYAREDSMVNILFCGERALSPRISRRFLIGAYEELSKVPMHEVLRGEAGFWIPFGRS